MNMKGNTKCPLHKFGQFMRQESSVVPTKQEHVLEKRCPLLKSTTRSNDQFPPNLVPVSGYR